MMKGKKRKIYRKGREGKAREERKGVQISGVHPLISCKGCSVVSCYSYTL